MNKYIGIIIITLLISGISNSQAVFEPVESDLYYFLERQAAKGLIEFNSEIKPQLRTKLSAFLLELEAISNKLSAIDADLLTDFMQDFSYEISLATGDVSVSNQSKFFKFDEKRIRLFEYSSNDFAFFADPMIEIIYGSNFSETIFIRRNGFRVHGYAVNNWRFDLRFFDNEEVSVLPDYDKRFLPERSNIQTKLKNDSFEYDAVSANVSYAWQTGAFTFGKDHFRIGSGRNGNIILSDKAPSFPFIRLDYYPVDWFSFFYFHGFLVSNVHDSSTFRINRVENRPSISDVPKYMAFHMVSFYPTKDVSFSLGESIVYSEFIQPIYFIPLMFFRVADHYLAKGNGSSSGNAQLFADFSYTIHTIKSKFYSTLFIDELSLNSIFEGGNLSALGFTAGAIVHDLVFNNSSLNVEYSRVNPFVYMNSVDAQQFSNDDYKLGHFIESNGDIISVEYRQQLHRSLSISIVGSILRSGKDELPDEQYSTPYPPIFYGAKRNETNTTLKIEYKPIRPLKAKVYYNFRDIDDQDYLRTPPAYQGSFNNFGISLSYGFE